MIRLYLQTLQRREVDADQRREFYQSMLLDTERLMHTVEQVLKAGEAAQRKRPRQLLPLEFNHLVRECLDLARSRHHLQADALDYRESLNGAASAEVAGDPEELRTCRFQPAR